MIGANPEKAAMQSRLRAHHETCNKRFKQWGILKQIYCHDLIDHHDVFSAVVVLTQLSFESGDTLFSVEYNYLFSISLLLLPLLIGIQLYILVFYVRHTVV